MLDKLIFNLSEYSYIRVYLLATSSVLIGSVPIVYLFSLIAGVEYTPFLLIISVLLPIILTPPVMYLMFRFFKHLKHFQMALDSEIAKNKEKELMLFEQSKFALMGEMLANISHQWKQPLNNINLAIVEAKFSGYSPDKLEKNFDIMESNTEYLSSTINQFMSYFESNELDDRKNLNELMSDIKQIMGIALENSEIKLDVHIDKSVESVYISISIMQIIINLLTNAKEELENITGLRKINLNFELKDSKLYISCCDNGSGIDKEIKNKIFEPYFSTKKHKQGSGLGLYMSRQIAKSFFNGDLFLCEDYKETCFKLVVPFSSDYIRKM